MKNVFIVGCKGIPANYGGYETFVEKLTEKKHDKKIKYHVACLSDNTNEFEHNGAHCFNLKIRNFGPAKAMIADIYALKYIINYVKKFSITDFTVLILACRIGIVFKKYVKKIHKLGGNVLINPDGHEWLRSKWSKPIKKYWKYSESRMVKYADLVICDSINIENYILREYGKYKPNTLFIAYGAEIHSSPIQCKEYEQWLLKNNVSVNNYYLIVGRFVPENNYEVMIREFLVSKTKKDLVIITNHKNSKLYTRLIEKLHFENDSRIKFVGTVYDEALLYNIRKNAYGYLHGHSVGGTNPSLLEALASTRLNLLYDCGFNKEVAMNSAIYWSLEPGNLANIIDNCEMLSNEELEKYDYESTKRIKENYNWELIVTKYEKVLIK